MYSDLHMRSWFALTKHSYFILIQKDVQEDLLRSRKARVESAIGIRHVIDLLSSERKLIVGHSCFLGTLFFAYRYFYDN